MNKISKYKNADIAVAIPIYIVIFILLWNKCLIGFGNIDESFYLTIPYRLLQGDGLFINEWHLSQMSGYLLVPLMKLFLSTHPNTDGIILWFRHAYVICNLLASIAVYAVLRKHSHIGSLLASIVLFIYAPFCISALSYNSMGIMFLTLGMSMQAGSDSAFFSFTAGIFYSFSVLCCPYLVIIFMLYTIVILGLKLLNKGNKTQTRKYSFFLIGIAISASTFLAFVFSKTDLSTLIKVISYIMNDPEHNIPLSTKIRSYVKFMIKDTKVTFYVLLCYAAAVLTGVFYNEKIKKWCLFAVLSLFLIHLKNNVDYYDYINHLMFPINYAALACFIIYPLKNNSTVFHNIWLPGMIYSFCLHMSSNNELYAIASASTVATVASIVIIIETVLFQLKNGDRSKSDILAKYALSAILVCVLSLQFSAVLKTRLKKVFWENSIKEQTNLIECGPEKGLLASDKIASEYLNCYESIKNIEKDRTVLFFDEHTWSYLCGEWKNGSYSAWLSGANKNAINKLEAYYAINPGKQPDIIVINEDETDNIEYIIASWRYTISDNQYGSKLILAKS